MRFKGRSYVIFILNSLEANPGIFKFPGREIFAEKQAGSRDANPRIDVLDAKRHISISHKNQSIWNIDTRFTASCSLRQDLSIAIHLKGVASGVGSQKRRRNRRFRRAGAVGYIHVREAVNPILKVGLEEWGGDDRYRGRWIGHYIIGMSFICGQKVAKK